MESFESDAFTNRVQALMNQHHVPGVSIALVQNDQIASRGYGSACLDPPIPCTPDTLFDIASSSKSLTAGCVGLLVDDDERYPEIRWDTILSELLPEDFVMPGVGYTEGVTIEDILSHRSGMPSHDSSYMGPRAVYPDDARSVTRNLRNLPVAAPIRSKYMYCNMMYTVASHLVEVKSRQSFSDFLQDRIFEPLNMPSTSLQPSRARGKGHGPRIAMGYQWNKTKSTYTEHESPDCPEGQGAGSIITSTNDFIKWVKALIDHETPITPRLYQGLVRLRTFTNPGMQRLKKHTSPKAYAAGLEVYFYRGAMVIGHEGCIDGFASRFFFLPDFRFGAVILTNSDDGTGLTTILARELIDSLLGFGGSNLPGTSRLPTRSKPKKTQKPKSATTTETLTTTDGTNQIENDSESDHVSDTTTQDMSNPDPASTPKPSESPMEQLHALRGEYTNPGYHTFVVQVKDSKVFIDASDRSTGFFLTFDHIRDQTEYVAHFHPSLDEDSFEDIRAEFVWENGRAVRMGLHMEPVLKELIWFERVD
ncbi:uncharacterized protein PV06_02053 [Exophiala oligosperma]|uniref:Beta-lactamase-related domain-containing protein n=2 Tax=Chaetothyriales TaxID=34395 RepID=A0A0D2EEK3_9EURO|nr:uncharacterized protein PV06_02053 [Exophiala oligosperma]KAJ9646233.1 hypothetical protein H2204_000896 [Knufia peltigerae]KIW46379.1 hypothetical protein PV06_02053 [Exophiala oligosperma]